MHQDEVDKDTVYIREPIKPIVPSTELPKGIDIALYEDLNALYEDQNIYKKI